MAKKYYIILCSLVFITVCNCHEYNYKGWEFASTYLKASMNKEIDPCEDFYGFVCGNWGKAFEKHTNTTTEFEKVNSRMAKLIAKAIKKIDLENPATQTFKKSMKVFYDQCQNSSNDDTKVFFSNIYEQIVKYFIPNIVVKSPTSNDSLSWEPQDKREFWRLVGLMQRELGVGLLFEAEVLPAQINCNIKPALHLRPTYMGRSVATDEEMLIFADIVTKYHNITLTEADKIKTGEAMKNFELNFKFIHQDYMIATMFEPRKQHRSSAELQKEIPGIDWAAYFEGLLPESIKRIWLKNPIVVMDNIGFFQEISEMIGYRGHLESSNYGFMSVMQKYLWFFKYSETKAADTKNLLDEQIFKQDKCLDRTVRYFSSAVLRLLCEEHGGDVEEWRTDMQLLKETTFSSFRFLLHNSKWLSAEEKMILTNRVNEIKFYGDIPSWIMDDGVINAKSPKYESSLTLVANDIVAQKNLFHEELKPLVTGQMDDLPPNFFHNAFNMIRGTGSIRFLIGWQLPPFYTHFYPLALKYGGTGFIIGHELMHSFGTNVYDQPEDVFLKQYMPDPYGFKNETLAKFEHRARCIVPYFDEYCQDDKYKCNDMNSFCRIGQECNIGNRTLEENTADNEAIKIAYNAYKFALQTVGAEPPVPDMMEYTNDHLFFIAFAREFCTTESVSIIENMFTAHSAFRARVEQPLMNFPKFAKAFGCSAKSRYGKRKNVCSLYGS